MNFFGKLLTAGIVLLSVGAWGINGAVADHSLIHVNNSTPNPLLQGGGGTTGNTPGTSVTTGGPGTSVTTGEDNNTTQGSQQGGSNGSTIEFDNPTPYNTIMELLRAVLDAIVRIMMPVIAVMFVVTGFMFVTAGGDEKKLETAKQMFFGTVVGAAIILGAWALATAIAGTIQQL